MLEKEIKEKLEYIDIYKALDLINNQIDYTTQEIELPIKKSIDHILSQDITATIDNPPFNNSAMDGIAIKYQDLKISNIFKITKLLRAKKINPQNLINYKKQSLNEYPTAIEISTGAIVPPEFNTIIPYEDLTFISPKIVKIKDEKLEKIKINQHIRFKGEDFQKDQIILKKGTLLTPLNISLLAFNGIKKVKVYKKPIISLITTGNEIIELHKKPTLGEIYNSNKYSLLAYITKLASPGIIKHIPDSKTKIKKTIEKALKISDIIITVGGISKGKYDLINNILEEINTKIIFKKLKLKPGKPTTFSIYQNKSKKVLIFSLPGNPISALFNFNKFIIPVIFKLQNYNYIPKKIKAQLIEDINIKKEDDRIIMLPSYCYSNDNGEYFVKPITKWGSHTIGILNQINSYIEINTNHIPSKTNITCTFLET